MAIAVIASVLAGFLMTQTAEGQRSVMCPLDEDFSGPWLPSGWTTDDWLQSPSNHAGGTSPEARLPWSGTGFYAYLDSESVNTASASNLTLEFKSFVDDYSGSGSYNCSVYTRADGGDSWTDVTPWSNPIWGDIDPNTYSVDISSDIGSATQVHFEFDGQSNDLNDWYVDDVRICFDIPPPSPPTVPTANRWGIVAMITLFAGLLVWALRRRRLAS